ncbi:hypothetical protein KC19_10G061100 [Ceratodon purpureus]|uniref:Uncharacterized protein n=1 Tax=Ceratodon purpureus TaxID=3225 RepID=A0A8T0GHF1_CERPU|nr:hypothetical protein KC19_10G061100 [Ceratodon purpureus]
MVFAKLQFGGSSNPTLNPFQSGTSIFAISVTLLFVDVVADAVAFAAKDSIFQTSPSCCATQTHTHSHTQRHTQRHIDTHIRHRDTDTYRHRHRHRETATHTES